MSCVILNTVKLCIHQAQTDISGEKVLSYINSVVNIEQEGRGVKRGKLLFPKFYERLHEARYLRVSAVCRHTGQMLRCFNCKDCGVVSISRHVILLIFYSVCVCVCVYV